jgi:hypothetical protein
LAVALGVVTAIGGYFDIGKSTIERTDPRAEAKAALKAARLRLHGGPGET